MTSPVVSPLALSRYLGMFSLALGAAEIAFPRILARRLGVWGGPWLVRAFGVREVAAGLAVLKDPGAPSGPAGRIAGDVLDIAVLIPGVMPSSYRRKAAGVAMLAVLGVTVLDVLCTASLTANETRRAETARRTRWTRPVAAIGAANGTAS